MFFWYVVAYFGAKLHRWLEPDSSEDGFNAILDMLNRP